MGGATGGRPKAEINCGEACLLELCDGVSEVEDHDLSVLQRHLGDEALLHVLNAHLLLRLQ